MNQTILMSNYGSFFKAARKAKSLTLRKVEQLTGISNAYLSQLETGKVKQPSPNVLYKLSELYEVPYEVLMEKVGYPVPGSKKETSDDKSVFRRIGKVTQDEEEALLAYLSFLRSQKKKK